MSFARGRVTFCRFLTRGDGPQQVDDPALSILNEHAFRETDIGAPDEVEAGFITAEHLLDTQFTYAKCGYGTPASPLLLFAMRMDTHRVPSEVKYAYRRRNELAAASTNPSGFASKSQRRDAKDFADRQLHEDLAAGRFRSSKSIPLLWDLANHALYCGSTAQNAHEQLSRLMREAFGIELTYASAGVAASAHLRKIGRGRDYEDLQPTPFTPPPPQRETEAFPLVPWVARGVDLKDFLGNEFLTWLWWKSEAAEGEVERDGRRAFVAIDRALDMDCAWDVRGKLTLRSDGPARLNEAAEALATGKWPRKVGLILSDGEHQWELTLQGDRMQVGSAKLPSIDDAADPRELVESRLMHAQTLARVLDDLYFAFLTDRTGAPWPTMRTTIRRWISERRPRAVTGGAPAVAAGA